ncbi:hypothetical protein HCN44_008537 [Aphidius gifuensis]|uniref:ATP synthase subunit b n=1 Tax=Aphidius gifuensis TaxID=684658 RepID=A0A834XMB7_APHGI|nr:ATP synthase subunit b, mitochondrial [Aphidius gifuensis]KAF7989863.1 hypothetical protein HCN44_008537 [Aphidius gifuensis]
MLSRIALRNAITRLPVVARAQSSSAVDTQRRGRPIDPSPVRHGFIPEEWFTCLYNKTGFTGPYMLALGLSTTLVSKEIYVLEHEYYTGVSVLIVSILAVKKLGPMVTKWIDEGMDKQESELNETRDSELRQYKDLIEHEKNQQMRTEAQQMILDAKKENIKMQLEAAYRERIHTVYTEVKKRLDYQLQIANVERRVAQKHMSDWIINSVLKSITPDQEKANLQQCIADLQALAPK